MLPVLLLACSSPDPTPVPVATESTDTAPTDTATTPASTTAQTADTAPTAHTGDTAPLETFDCTTVGPVTATEVRHPDLLAYNDIGFLADGTMVTAHDTNLHIATDPTTTSLWIPTTGYPVKLGLLPGGDLLATVEGVDTDGVIRVAPTGSVSNAISGDLFYGIEVSPSGLVYLATEISTEGAGIFLADPATGSLDRLFSFESANQPRDIVLHPDGTRLYWGTLESGRIYAVDVDPTTALPTGDPVLVGTLPVEWHDALEIDACGNLYVAARDPSNDLVRLRTDGTTELLVDWNFTSFGHGLGWGDPTGGWNDHALYIAHPYADGSVTELDIGVPGPRWPGIAVNAGRL